MIGEIAVLFGIQYLEQGAGRISVVGDGQLVDLVEDHDGIGDTALLDAVHDPAGHGPYISAPVAADVRFIAHTAQTHARVFAVKGFGYTLTNAGLAGSGSSDEAENGAGLLFFQIHHGNLLDNALFNLFESEMVFFEYGFRLVEIDFLSVLVFPGQTCDEIQIVVQHTGFGTVLSFLLIAVEDLVSLLAGCLVHP